MLIDNSRKKIHRFITNFNDDKSVIEINDKDVVRQIGRVLKLRSGERVIIGKGDGLEVLAKIVKTEKGVIYLEPQKVIKNENEPSRHVALYCSILKKENFEMAAQKATEIGVSAITPIITKRTVKTNINIERLNKIIKEAADTVGKRDNAQGRRYNYFRGSDKSRYGV